uniref:NADH-ubiquinone oxidoreductase chain 3 n=1 Tax=Lepidotrema longipenis TaxID=330067 RepID=A0A346Q025_9PLAT|nr:NADH dehydrogenase subunit 3 [Lepidotrema longipenis]AXR86351.1 NADH dehydrogenase subunit 3 [Lepidotrema longipenis]
MSLLILFLCISLIFFLLICYNSFWYGDNYSNDNKLVWISSFECGFLGENSNINSFSVNFFILLVFFVVFDLEISLLLNFPFQGSFFKSLYFYNMFILIICLGYLFEVLKGFINWEN